jgi:hypothetical protein
MFPKKAGSAIFTKPERHDCRSDKFDENRSSFPEEIIEGRLSSDLPATGELLNSLK